MPADSAQPPIPQPDMPQTEADSTSDTRFGPRPVPPGHHRPQDPPKARRIPPHGAVSPDGRRPWPKPSKSAKWLSWGGTALTAAALTAGTVIAARQVIHMLSDDKPRRAPSHNPPRRAQGFAAAPPAPAPKPRRRAPRVGLMQEIESNTASLTQGVENVMQAVTAGMTGFRTVSGQASAIMREFGDAAALVQTMLGRNRPTTEARPSAPRPSQPRPQDRHGAHMPDLRDDPLTHDPLDGRDAPGPQDHDPRMHRL